jgi:hypothetical protein
MTKDEALKLAFALDYWATQTDMGRKPDPKSLIRRASAELRRLQAERDAIKQALAAPVEPDWKAEYLKSVESGCITLDELREARAELDATNRQVEILSDALAESQREVAALKAVQEPVAWMQSDEVHISLWKDDYHTIPLYATPPAAPVLEGRDWSLLEATQESLREHMAEIKRLKAAQPAVPLTDEQIESLLPDDDTPMSLGEAFVKFARLVEAHHGITKGQS